MLVSTASGYQCRVVKSFSPLLFPCLLSQFLAGIAVRLEAYASTLTVQGWGLSIYAASFILILINGYVLLHILLYVKHITLYGVPGQEWQ